MVEKTSKLKILVLGASGLLGSEVVRHLNHTVNQTDNIVKGVNHRELDITHGKDVAIYIERFQPDVVINCAALSNVDYCEEHPQEAMRVNAEAIRNICFPLEEIGGKLVHISTDYVFDGKKEDPYEESDPVNPLNHYAESKLKGEEYASQLLPNSLIIRVQWLYGAHGTNFSSQMIREITTGQVRTSYSLLEDRIGCPTSIHDLVPGIECLMKSSLSGIYHISCAGYCSWVQFGETIGALNGDSPPYPYIRSVRGDDLKRPAKRPRSTVISCQKLNDDLGFTLPKWQKSLEDVIRRIK